MWKIIGVLALLSATTAAQAQAEALPRAARPEDVGLSSAQLKRIEEVTQKHVDSGLVPGAVMLVARRGKIAWSATLGKRDVASGDAMKPDSIFRIYSMTKPLASVAAMMLVEDGVLQVGDPVSRWLPAFRTMKVSTPSGEVDAARQMTVQDLLRHSAGLPYGELTTNASVKDALARSGLYLPGVIDFDVRNMTAAEQVDRLSKIPLVHQPGTTWEYSLATDVLGRVVEAAAGKRLGEFLEARLFAPLRMKDSAFHVPAAKLPRLAAPFEKDPATGNPQRLIDVTKPPGNDSGGAGGVSTAHDYIRFAQMLLNGGVLDGRRVLSRTTVRYMASDHLGTRITLPPGSSIAVAGYTFGLGFAVRPQDGVAIAAGTAGDYNWSGYAGTHFWVDPAEQLVAVYMSQTTNAMRLYHRNLVRQLVYQAIAD